jgi:hypothetical protein
MFRNHKELVNFRKVEFSLKNQVLSTAMSKAVSVKIINFPFDITLIPDIQFSRQSFSRSRQNCRKLFLREFKKSPPLHVCEGNDLESV